MRRAKLPDLRGLSRKVLRRKPRRLSVAKQHSLSGEFDPTVPIFFITLLAVLGNTLLAIVNAHGLTMGRGAVILSEVAVLAPGLWVVVRTGLRPGDGGALLLLYAFTVISILVSLIGGFFYPDPFRNVAIIAIFTLLGLRSDPTLVRRVFLIASVLVLAGLVLEIVSSTSYVWLFQPAYYYANTRGAAEHDWDQSGLFQNASGFAARFTFGLLSHRASSIFLEQVSLGNYAAILCIFLVSLWSRLSWLERGLQTGVIILILLATSARTSSALTIALIAGYFVFPYLPRLLRLVFAPAAIILALVEFNALNRSGDNLIGRINITGQTLAQFDGPTMLGMHAASAYRLADTGYGYVIASMTIFGAIILWLYFSLLLPDDSPSLRRSGWATSSYLFANLMIGGTSIFALKIAGLLWLLEGSMLRTALEARPALKAEEPDVVVDLARRQHVFG